MNDKKKTPAEEEEETFSFTGSNEQLATVTTDEQIDIGKHIATLKTMKKHKVTFKDKNEEGCYLDVIFTVDGHEIRKSAPLSKDATGNLVIRNGTQAGSLAKALLEIPTDTDLPEALDFRPLVGKDYLVVVTYAQKNGQVVKTKAGKKVVEVDTILGPAPKAGPQKDVTKTPTPAAQAATTPAPGDLNAVIEECIKSVIGSGTLVADVDPKFKKLAQDNKWNLDTVEAVAHNMIVAKRLILTKDLFDREMLKVA